MKDQNSNDSRVNILTNWRYIKVAEKMLGNEKGEHGKDDDE